jgi:hypothetical protein
MNKQAIRSMLIKEVKVSNLSELAKGMLEEMLDSENYNPEKEVTAVRTHKEGNTTISIPQPLASRLAVKKPGGKQVAGKRGAKSHLAEREKLYGQIYQETLGLLETRSEKNPAFRITISQLARRYKLQKHKKYELRDFLLRQARHGGKMVVDKGNRITGWVVSLPGYVPDEANMQDKRVEAATTTKEHVDYPFCKRGQEDEPRRLNKLEFRKKFMRESTIRHLAEGMDYIKASHMSAMEYSAFCKKRDAGKTATRHEPPATDGTEGGADNSTPYESVAYIEFPTLNGLKDTSIPYLKDLLKKLDSGMVAAVTEAMDGYVLDVEPNKWATFLVDVMLRGNQIKEALGLTKSKNFVVRYGKLFFE